MKRSFTMVEILTVVAIIGALFGISLKYLSSSRVRARDVIRKQNLQSVSLSFTMYRNDFNKYPIDDTSRSGFCSTLPSYTTQYTNWGALVTAMKPYIDPMPKDPLSSCTGTYATTIGYAALPEYTYNVRTDKRYSFAANLENDKDSERGSLGGFSNLLYGTDSSNSNPHIYMVGCRLDDPAAYRTTPCR